MPDFTAFEVQHCVLSDLDWQTTAGFLKVGDVVTITCITMKRLYISPYPPALPRVVKEYGAAINSSQRGHYGGNTKPASG